MWLSRPVGTRSSARNRAWEKAHVAEAQCVIEAPHAGDPEAPIMRAP
jgi:hypothetical protein